MPTLELTHKNFHFSKIYLQRLSCVFHMHPDMEILESAITKAMPRPARGCLLSVRPQKREPCTRMGRGASDLESPCTEQMGSAWDEETY